MSAFLDAAGAVQQLPLSVGMYREASELGMGLPQYLGRQYPTNPEKYGSTFQQLMRSEGIYLSANRELGIRPSTMAEILNPPLQAGVVVKDAIPASRILFPAVFLQAVEDKLVANLSMTADAFESMIAVNESINGDRYEQPQVNFSRPESATNSPGIAQLAAPASMMIITTSDKAFRIPQFALGMEIADQALKSTTVDFVALSLARQAAVQRNQRANDYILALFNGDTDNGEASLSSLGYVDASTVFDSTATGGVFTQKAWMKYLLKNGTKRTITHIVTDFDTALKIENRTGKPVITTDDPNSVRIDTTFAVMNPTWAKHPSLFLTDNAAWPAATLMGLDKSWAIRRVRNISAEYTAIEAYVMRRSQAMRFDFAEHVNRLYPEAFGCMTLA